MKKGIMLSAGLVSLIALVLVSLGAQKPETKEFDLGKCQLRQEQVQGAIDFHGHFCPGLTIGIRASEWCLRELGSGKEGKVSAIVETNRCGSDAVQFLTGCTFGKRNFVHKDYGKAVYNFYRKEDGKCFRLYLNPALTADINEEQAKLDPQDKEGRNRLRQKMIRRMFDASLEEMFLITEPHYPFEKSTQTKETRLCEQCGESVETGHVQKDGKGRNLCGECFGSLADPEK